MPVNKIKIKQPLFRMWLKRNIKDLSFSIAIIVFLIAEIILNII